MNLALDYTNKEVRNVEITVSGSKSESNRLLILQQWFPNLFLKNLSDSDDTRHLQKALSSTDTTINIGHAGTAMRFLTAYFAVTDGRERVLTGSERMQNRPIRILVDALRTLGATIDYVEKEGYPPLKIKGRNILKDKVRIQGNVSSQYISALLLIAPKLKNGLGIELVDTITSRPWILSTKTLRRGWIGRHRPRGIRLDRARRGACRPRATSVASSSHSCRRCAWPREEAESG